MAPELFDYEVPQLRFSDRTTDIFALGCTIFEIYTREIPWPRLTEPAVINAVVNGKRPVQPQGSGMSLRTWNLVQRCWDQQRGLRPSIEEVCAVLEGNQTDSGDSYNSVGRSDGEQPFCKYLGW
jgi:serine/threonine protein kinase